MLDAHRSDTEMAPKKAMANQSQKCNPVLASVRSEEPRTYPITANGAAEDCYGLEQGVLERRIPGVSAFMQNAAEVRKSLMKEPETGGVVPQSPRRPLHVVFGQQPLKA